MNRLYAKRPAHRAVVLAALAVLGALTLFVSCPRNAGPHPRAAEHTAAAADADAFINNPFAFTILKNISDDYGSIGTILKSTITCPLEKENIADPAFCFIRTVEYDGLTVRIFSFDVMNCGTAEYVVHGDSVKLRNGLAVGSAKADVVRALGKPFRETGAQWIWRSGDLHNYLSVTFEGERVLNIRWHEDKDASYNHIRVWN